MCKNNFRQLELMLSFCAPIHNDGWKFVGIFAAFTVFLWWLHPFVGGLAFLLTGWCLYFFRNPARVVPSRAGLVVSAADGIISSIRLIEPPAEWGLDTTPCWRISVFLNVFDVHVNRIPYQGTVVQKIYSPGKFLNASLDKSSDENERLTLVLKTEDEKFIAVTQIAGFIARRIRCDVGEGSILGTGQLYGLIRFGSRVDVYLPQSVNPLVVEGQRMIGGETVIADLTSTEGQRQGQKG